MDLFKSFNKKLNNIKKNFKNKYLGHTSSSIGELQLKLYKNRLKKVRLTWCQQVLEIIKKLNYSNPKINDLGCNYFQFFKEIKISKYKCDYFGYDMDKSFINLGLSKFPELKNKYKITNIENTKLRKTDISIISDTLEYCGNPKKFLKNVILSTKKNIILRTFISDVEKVKLIKDKRFIKNPYFVNSFTFKMIIHHLLKYDFFPQIYPDLATNCSQINEVFPNIKRRFFIIVFTKRDILLKKFRTKKKKKLYSNKKQT